MDIDITIDKLKNGVKPQFGNLAHIKALQTLSYRKVQDEFSKRCTTTHETECEECGGKGYYEDVTYICPNCGKSSSHYDYVFEKKGILNLLEIKCKHCDFKLKS